MSQKSFTRKEYLNRNCTHREYYSQFVTDGIKQIVKMDLGDKIIKSEDEHFNDIPLKLWDNLGSLLVSQPFIHRRMKERGDYLTKAGLVCILKESARQILEENTENE